MTKKKQKRPLNTYIGGSRSNKKKTKRNVLGIRRRIIGGEGGEFDLIWVAYEGLNTAIKGTDAGKIGTAMISAARRFVVSTMIVVLQSKSTIENFMSKNNIKVEQEIKDVTFEPEDKAFIMLFKTDKTSRVDMETAYNKCLTQPNGVVNKLKSKFDEVIKSLSSKTQTISSNPETAVKAFDSEIKAITPFIDMHGTKALLSEVETTVNEANPVEEGEVSIVEDAVEEGAGAEAEPETTTEAEAGEEGAASVPEKKKSILSRMFGSKPQEEGTETTPAEPKKSFLSYFKKPTAEQPVEQPTAQTEGGSRKKRKYHKGKYRKSSQRKK